MEEEMHIAAQAKKEKKSLKTGAKVALATVGVLAVLGGGIAATYFGIIPAVQEHKEAKRAESLVSYYIDEDKLVSFPETVVIDQAYDAEYCSGEKLVTELTESGAQYCVIDGQYYTEKGETIAILTLDVTRTDTVDPIKQDLNGQTVYMAPGSGFYTSPGLGKDQVRIAYALNKEELAKAVVVLAKALEAYPGRTL